MDKPKHKYEGLLMEAIGFTEDDLEANREGFLSSEQITLLRRNRYFWLVVACITGVAAFGLAIYSQSILGCISFAATPPLFAILKILMLDEVLKGRKVESAEGYIQLDMQGQGTGNILIVDDITFKVSKKVFLAFKNGDPYLIHYLPKMMKILSAEWLR